MIYYWTKNRKVGSRLIQWGLNDDCSHFAVGFWDHDTSLILESRLGHGFQPSWKADFIKRNTVVHALRYVEDGKWEAQMYRKVSKGLYGTDYDYKGILFWSVIAAAFKMRIVTKDEMDGFNNRWADRDSAYCAEVLKVQKDFLNDIGFDMDYLNRQNLRPHLAYKLLKSTGKFEDLPIDEQVY